MNRLPFPTLHPAAAVTTPGARPSPKHSRLAFRFTQRSEIRSWSDRSGVSRVYDPVYNGTNKEVPQKPSLTVKSSVSFRLTEGITPGDRTRGPFRDGGWWGWTPLGVDTRGANPDGLSKGPS